MLPDTDIYYDKDEYSWRRPRRHWPINEPDMTLTCHGAPSIEPGDVVVWKQHPDDTEDTSRVFYSPFYMNKTVGLVLLTRWTRMDWGTEEEVNTLYPEALVLWEDGDTTNTSHPCLERLK